MVTTGEGLAKGCHLIREVIGYRNYITLMDSRCRDAHILSKGSIQADTEGLVIRAEVVEALYTLRAYPATDIRGHGHTHPHFKILHLRTYLDQLATELVTQYPLCPPWYLEVARRQYADISATYTRSPHLQENFVGGDRGVLHLFQSHIVNIMIDRSEQLSLH
jgi:hypothetical protein